MLITLKLKNSFRLSDFHLKWKSLLPYFRFPNSLLTKITIFFHLKKEIKTIFIYQLKENIFCWSKFLSLSRHFRRCSLTWLPEEVFCICMNWSISLIKNEIVTYQPDHFSRHIHKIIKNQSLHLCWQNQRDIMQIQHLLLLNLKISVENWKWVFCYWLAKFMFVLWIKYFIFVLCQRQGEKVVGKGGSCRMLKCFLVFKSGYHSIHQVTEDAVFLVFAQFLFSTHIVWNSDHSFVLNVSHEFVDWGDYYTTTNDNWSDWFFFFFFFFFF